MIEITYKHFFSEFFLHAIKAIHTNDSEFDMLDIAYKFINNVDTETLFEFKKHQSLMTYENDLVLFIEMIKYVNHLYEQKEEYEICSELIIKQKNCEMMLNNQD
jgi:hypothetical protein